MEVEPPRLSLRDRNTSYKWFRSHYFGYLWVSSVLRTPHYTSLGVSSGIYFDTSLRALLTYRSRQHLSCPNGAHRGAHRGSTSIPHCVRQLFAATLVGKSAQSRHNRHFGYVATRESSTIGAFVTLQDLRLLVLKTPAVGCGDTSRPAKVEPPMGKSGSTCRLFFFNILLIYNY